MTSEIRVWFVLGKNYERSFSSKTTLEALLFVQVDSVNYFFQTNWICGILCLLYSILTSFMEYLN